MFEENTKKFLNWVNENFTNVSPKFQVVDLRNKGQGRGLIATKDISSNEVLFELSRDTILNINTASISSINKENLNILKSLNQWQALIVCVAYEWYLGDKSKFIHYFNVLPFNTEDYNSLMFWKDEELQYLKPSGVLQRIGKSAAEEMYSLLVADIIPNRLKCKELADFLTLEKFHIVASLIMSYSFDVDDMLEDDDVDASDESDSDDSDDNSDDNSDDDKKEKEETSQTDHFQHDKEQKPQHEHKPEYENENQESKFEEIEKEVDENGNENIIDDDVDISDDPVSGDSYLKSMVPLADTLNSNTSLVNATLKYEATKLVMVADKPIKKGEQIFNLYGELPNSEILRKYGYVELPSSKFEFAEISKSTIKRTFEKIFAKKLQFLKEIQIENLIKFLFETIEESEYLEENLTPEMEFGIISEKYEIYSNGEIIPELILLVLIITSIIKAAESDEKWFKKIVKSIERKPSMDLIAFVNRSILKCHQLLENKNAITIETVENIKAITQERINEYPSDIIDETYKLPEIYQDFSRKDLSNIVLFDEVSCLKDVINGKFPPKTDQTVTVIEDDKFLRNLLKRKIEEQSLKSSKKHKK